MADTEAQPGQPADGQATIARLADEALPMLIERLTNSELGELEVREDGWRIRLRRAMRDNAVGADADAAPRPAASGGHSTPAPPRDVQRGAVTSPAVGYFATRSGVEVGTRLRNGDAIGYIDVLGVRHDVVSHLDGVLRTLDVEAGQAVEYGQQIARVEPEA